MVTAKKIFINIREAWSSKLKEVEKLDDYAYLTKRG